MIYLYSGTPGSGKSLHVARVIRSTLLLNKPVLANIPINTDRIRHPERFIYVPDARLRPSALMEYSQKHFEGKTVKEGEILLIIDEAQRLFNARDWSKSDRAAWNEFFQLHRHFGYDIILVAQFDRMLDRQVRSVIEYEQIHRKVSNYGWRGWLLCALMVAPALFVSVKMWYPMRERVGSEFFRYSKRLGRMYDTFMTFPAVEDSGETGGVSV
jgi:zona occludens toxin (predicted ATPase)